MSLWSEGNSIDELLESMQTNAGGYDQFTKYLKRRRQVLKQLQEIVEKHYVKKGAV